MMLGIDASRAVRTQRTGVEEYAYRLLEGMVATSPIEIRVRLYLNDELGIRNKESWLSDLPSNWEIRVLPWPKRVWTHTALAWELWKNPPDVFFQPSHVLPVWGIKNKESGIRKLVITVHDVGFARIPWAYPPFERWYQDIMTKFEIRNSKWGVRVIVPSEFTKKELIELYSVAPDRITVIPHASSVTGSRIQKIESRSGVDACGFPYILSIGRIEKKKNTLGMIQAFEGGKLEIGNKKLDIDACHYVLIGSDGYGADEVYAYLATRPELQSRVHLLGYVPEERKRRLLVGAQALVHLSHYEGFGLPIAEARAAGVPVIATREWADLETAERDWDAVARDTWKVLQNT